MHPQAEETEVHHGNRSNRHDESENVEAFEGGKNQFGRVERIGRCNHSFQQPLKVWEARNSRSTVPRRPDRSTAAMRGRPLLSPPAVFPERDRFPLCCYTPCCEKPERARPPA